jgi:hypothetical protein
MPTNNRRGETLDPGLDPRTGLPESPASPMGAGGIPPPTPLLPAPLADYAQRLIGATLAGQTLPGPTMADLQDLYLSHSPVFPGTDPGPFAADPYRPRD